MNGGLTYKVLYRANTSPGCTESWVARGFIETLSNISCSCW